MLVSGSSVFACEPFKAGFSFPHSSVVFLDVLSVGFQRQVFWGLISPMQDLRDGVPDV